MFLDRRDQLSGGDRVVVRHAAEACGSEACGDFHVGATARRMGLRGGFCADSNDSNFVCHGEFDGLAVHRVDAHFCFEDFEGWRAHVGISDGSGRHRRADFSAVARGTKECAGAGADDLYFDGGVRSEFDIFRVVAKHLAFAGDDAVLWLWNDAANGGQQHDHPNDC